DRPGARRSACPRCTARTRAASRRERAVRFPVLIRRWSRLLTCPPAGWLSEKARRAGGRRGLCEDRAKLNRRSTARHTGAAIPAAAGGVYLSARRPPVVNGT